MFYLVLASLLGFVAVLLLLLTLKAPSGQRGKFGLSFGITLFILVLLTLAEAATTVSPRAVGIQTAFGKYQGTLQSGFHMTAPWSGVEEFPTQVQFLDLNNGKAETSKGTVGVNYKGGGKGQVDATIRWRIDTSNAAALWRKYRTFENVRDQLVISSARDSVSVIIGAYAPNDARAGENRRKISSDVALDLNKVLSSDGITIDSVSVTDVRLDDKTQASIEAIVKANADIDRAKAEQKKALIDAQTAKIREQSGSLSAGALERYCLDVTNAWNQGNNGPLPTGWTCLGDKPSVVVSGK